MIAGETTADSSLGGTVSITAGLGSSSTGASGGDISLTAGQGNGASGGSVSLSTGYGAAKSSGLVKLQTVNAGTSGVSGGLIICIWYN